MSNLYIYIYIYIYIYTIVDSVQLGPIKVNYPVLQKDNYPVLQKDKRYDKKNNLNDYEWVFPVCYYIKRTEIQIGD